ncbi:MAG: excinuclease ABC subunit UvrC [Myxococcales bacterium]|nr:excinuclease ABC subunit UvrC [Myxococcales bacterium]
MHRAAGRNESTELVCADGALGDLSSDSDQAVSTRRSARQRGKVRLFGPYSSSTSIRQTLRFLERQFQLRTCTDRQLTAHANRGRACLQFQMHRCSGPCIGAVSAEAYAEQVRDVVQFLEGKPSEVLERLEAQMIEAAEALEFERAAALRDRSFAIARSLERQQMVSEDLVDRDVAGIAREANRLVIYLLFIRGGRLIGGHAFPFNDQEFPSQELLSSFLQLYYGGEVVIPQELLLPFELPEAEALEAWLTERRGERAVVRTPKRGAKAELIAMAQRNAAQTLSANVPSKDETRAVLERLQKRLRLSRLPRKIECYDISLFQGDSAVGSGVCFVDGTPFKPGYRRYRIKTVQGTDDFAMLYEVLRRRATHGELPDLFLIDGGKGQLASATSALRDAGIEPGTHTDLISIAKSRLVESKDSGSKRSDERVFVADTKDPIVLDQNSPELFLLTRLRDEAHRFAITFHRTVRSKRALTSQLDSIEGVGKARRTRLLKHFGSLRKLQEASLEEIAAVQGIGPKLAAQIREAIDSKENK